MATAKPNMSSNRVQRDKPFQEYSRVLCNGLINSPPNAGNKADHLCDKANVGSLRSELRYALTGLLAHEQKCLTEAADGTVEGLCDLLEHGSLLPLNATRDMPLPLRTELAVAIAKLDELNLARGPQTVVTRHFGGRYFSWEQAIDLDAALAVIHSEDQPIRDFYLAAALVVASDIVKHGRKSTSRNRSSYEMVTATPRDTW